MQLGKIFHTDLTVPNAEEVSRFYSSVVGWVRTGVDMGGYDDYQMATPSNEPGAGICHTRGFNADLPPQWLVYIPVANLETSLNTCRELGGEVLTPVKSLGDTMNYAVIRDPAGAVCALVEETPAE